MIILVLPCLSSAFSSRSPSYGPSASWYWLSASFLSSSARPGGASAAAGTTGDNLRADSAVDGTPSPLREIAQEVTPRSSISGGQPHAERRPHRAAGDVRGPIGNAPAARQLTGTAKGSFVSVGEQNLW